MKRPLTPWIVSILLAGCALGGNMTPSAPTDTAVPSAAHTAPPLPDRAAVLLPQTDSCGRGRCYTLEVVCAGLPARTAQVRHIQALEPRGTIFFTTGSEGNLFYAEMGGIALETVKTVTQAGFETFEIAWQGRDGWMAGAEGAGYTNALCGYAAVVRFVLENLAAQSEYVLAQGNSGGGMQIAYGLAVYGLEDVLDVAILSGGPPVSRLDVACFGTDDEALKPAVWPPTVQGLERTDWLMGWQGNGDYCSSHAAPQEIIAQAQADSLVPPDGARRDYGYPNTRVYFVNSEADKTAADEQGRLYFIAILSEKFWLEISGREHEISMTEDGAALIRQILLGQR
ncbi:MAG TPA: hypothetical protein PK152_04990 [Anaerolineales bacterium]|nr:hypothetical protein [Anaerolineae bacterium]HRJ57648.1 hypothetical protein [Anaerolineales bacterium]HRK88467.1 hypothetical protein [Anaerolineales bacterium]